MSARVQDVAQAWDEALEENERFEEALFVDFWTA